MLVIFWSSSLPFSSYSSSEFRSWSTYYGVNLSGLALIASKRFFDSPLYLFKSFNWSSTSFNSLSSLAASASIALILFISSGSSRTCLDLASYNMSLSSPSFLKAAVVSPCKLLHNASSLANFSEASSIFLLLFLLRRLSTSFSRSSIYLVFGLMSLSCSRRSALISSRAFKILPSSGSLTSLSASSLSGWTTAINLSLVALSLYRFFSTSFL